MSRQKIVISIIKKNHKLGTKLDNNEIYQPIFLLKNTKLDLSITNKQTITVDSWNKYKTVDTKDIELKTFVDELLIKYNNILDNYQHNSLPFDLLKMSARRLSK